MTKRTPTPWYGEDTGDGYGPVILRSEITNAEIADCTGGISDGLSREQCVANAQHIVRCVNAHDALVEACRSALLTHMLLAKNREIIETLLRRAGLGDLCLGIGLDRQEKIMAALNAAERK